MNEMSQAEYSRHKQVSRSMVTKWKSDGRLVLTKCGKRVLVNESDKRIRETANLNNTANEMQAAAARVEVKERTFTELREEVNKSQLDLETDNAEELYKNSRALREKSAALQAAAEYEKYTSALVSKEVVEKIIFERARALRDTLLTSARRMSPIIAGNESITEIELLLKEEYRGLLEQFAKMPIIE